MGSWTTESQRGRRPKSRCRPQDARMRDWELRGSALPFRQAGVWVRPRQDQWSRGWLSGQYAFNRRGHRYA